MIFKALVAVRNLKRSAALVAAALALAWFAAWALARALIVRDVPVASDALVVLAGSAAYDERTRYAAQLFHAGYAPIVFLTNDGQRGGWSNKEQRNPFFVERARESLRRAGVPEERIAVLPQRVSSTYEEAVALRHLAAERRIRSLLIVTSAYHARRARWIFNQIFAGSETRVTVVSPERPSPSPFVWWASLRGWRAVAAEYLKIIYYRWQYGRWFPQNESLKQRFVFDASPFSLFGNRPRETKI
jgi:uncharacterized SAM-binding protein YcdF (DUF218 family)